jgi:hypothetical protein
MQGKSHGNHVTKASKSRKSLIRNNNFVLKNEAIEADGWFHAGLRRVLTSFPQSCPQIPWTALQAPLNAV